MLRGTPSSRTSMASTGPLTINTVMAPVGRIRALLTLGRGVMLSELPQAEEELIAHAAD
jgi:hypothetical protein